MAFIPVPDVCEVFFEHTGPDDVILGNVMNFRDTIGPVSISSMTTLAAALVAWYDTDMQPYKTAGYQLTRLRMRDLTTDGSWVLDYTTGLPLVGTSLGNSLPSNVAWCLKLGTNQAGRSKRGRVYHFGLSEADVTGNYVESSYAEDVLLGYQNLIADVLAVDWQWVVVSRQQDGGPLVEGQAYNVATVTATDLRVDTQRRRLPDE